MDYTFFFKPEHENGVFSHWANIQMSSPAFPGMVFQNGEQWMMYMKALVFQDFKVAKKIMETTRSNVIKALGREVQNFNNDRWGEAMPGIIAEGNRIKFAIPGVEEFLMETRNTVLVEASPYDQNYGIKMDKFNPGARTPEAWGGGNILGFELTDLRIRKSNEPGSPYAKEDPDFILEYEQIKKEITDRFPFPRNRLTPALQKEAMVSPVRPPVRTFHRPTISRKICAPPTGPQKSTP